VYDEIPTSLRITITDPVKAQESLARIRAMIGHAEKKECPKCDKPLVPANLEYYDHEGGYDLPGFGRRQWLYHQCECGYGYSLWKLRIPISQGLNLLKKELGMKGLVQVRA